MLRLDDTQITWLDHLAAPRCRPRLNSEQTELASAALTTSATSTSRQIADIFGPPGTTVYRHLDKNRGRSPTRSPTPLTPAAYSVLLARSTTLTNRRDKGSVATTPRCCRGSRVSREVVSRSVAMASDFLAGHPSRLAGQPSLPLRRAPRRLGGALCGFGEAGPAGAGTGTGPDRCATTSPVPPTPTAAPRERAPWRSPPAPHSWVGTSPGTSASD